MAPWFSWGYLAVFLRNCIGVYIIRFSCTHDALVMCFILLSQELVCNVPFFLCGYIDCRYYPLRLITNFWYLAVNLLVSSLSHIYVLFGRTASVVRVPGYRTEMCCASCEVTNKLHGLSPRANYTDRATAACRRSDCQRLRIKGATWSAW
jgi:hypothetical protein